MANPRTDLEKTNKAIPSDQLVHLSSKTEELVRQTNPELEKERLLKAICSRDIKTIAKAVKQGVNINVVFDHEFSLAEILSLHSVSGDIQSEVTDVLYDMVHTYPRENYPKPLNVNHVRDGTPTLYYWLRMRDENLRIMDLLEFIIKNKNIFHADLNLREGDKGRTTFAALISHCLKTRKFELIEYVLQHYSQEEADINMRYDFLSDKGYTGAYLLAEAAVKMDEQRDNAGCLSAWNLLRIAMTKFNIDFDNEVSDEDGRLITLRQLIYHRQQNLYPLVESNLASQKKEKADAEQFFKEAVYARNIQAVAQAVKQGVNINLVLDGISLVAYLSEIAVSPLSGVIDVLHDMVHTYPRVDYPAPLNFNSSSDDKHNGRVLHLWITVLSERHSKIQDLIETVITNKNKFHANLNYYYEVPFEKETTFAALIEYCLKTRRFELIQYVLQNYSEEEADINKRCGKQMGIKDYTGAYLIARAALELEQKGDYVHSVVHSVAAWNLLKLAMTKGKIDFKVPLIESPKQGSFCDLINHSRQPDLISLMKKQLQSENKKQRLSTTKSLLNKIASQKKEQSSAVVKTELAPEKKETKPKRKQQQKIQQKTAEEIAAEKEAIEKRQISELEKTVEKKIEKLNKEVEELQRKIKAAEAEKKPLNEIFRRLEKKSEPNQWNNIVVNRFDSAKNKEQKSLDEYKCLDAKIDDYFSTLSKLEECLTQFKAAKKPSTKLHPVLKQQSLTPQEKQKLKKELRKKELEEEEKQRKMHREKRNEEKEKKKSEAAKRKEDEMALKEIRDRQEQEKAARDARQKTIEAKERQQKEEEQERKTILFYVAVKHLTTFLINGMHFDEVEQTEKKTRNDYTELKMFRFSAFYHLMRFYVVMLKYGRMDVDDISVRHSLAHLTNELGAKDDEQLTKMMKQFGSTIVSQLKHRGVEDRKQCISALHDLTKAQPESKEKSTRTNEEQQEEFVASITETDLYREFSRINDAVIFNLAPMAEDEKYRELVKNKIIPSMNRLMKYFQPIANKLKEEKKMLEGDYRCVAALDAIKGLLEWCGELYNPDRAKRFKANRSIPKDEIKFLKAVHDARNSMAHDEIEISYRRVKELVELGQKITRAEAPFENPNLSFSLRERKSLTFSDAKISSVVAAPSFTANIGARTAQVREAPKPTAAPVTELAHVNYQN